jgi:hypothetical protein
MNPSTRFPNQPSLDDQAPEDEIVPPRRMFLFEPGWRVGVKTGSEREFCYMMNPGQDFYHRLVDGEIFLEHAEERLCLACASRRGLIAFEPRRLRDSIGPVAVDLEAVPLELDWRDANKRNG